MASSRTWIERVRGAGDILRSSVAIFGASRSHHGAAAMAYFGMLSLVPFLVVAASAIGFLLSGSEGGGTQAYEVVARNLGNFLPQLEGEAAQRLRDLVEAREVTGLLGLVVLVATASLFFQSVGTSVGAIFEPERRRRTFLRSKAVGLAFVPMVILLFGLAYWGLSALGALVAWMGVADQPLSFRDLPAVRTAVTALGLFMGFFAIVYGFGSRRVAPRHAAIGGFVFTALWLAAQKLFALYISLVAEVSAIYGSLSALMVVVLWTYYASLLLLFCCCLTEALRRREGFSVG